MKTLVGKALLALDVAVNRVFNGRVETISARAGRAKRKGRRWGKVLCGFLHAVDPGHCEDADAAGPFNDR